MFRIFFRNLAIQKNICDDLLKIRYSTTAASTPELEEKNDCNRVKLLGTIVTHARTLPVSGKKSIVIRTDDDEGTYQNHQVNVFYDEPMTIGQRIYVDGIIRSKQFTLDDGRSRQRLIIRSKFVQLKGPEHNTDGRDVNNVKMIAKICSEIRHTTYFTTFTLEANHTVKRDGGTVITEYHRVLVYDELTRKMMRNLNRFDRVQVDGKVSYTRYKDSSGKILLGGYIVAQIIKPVE